jgi:hypothetical protein
MVRLTLRGALLASFAALVLGAGGARAGTLLSDPYGAGAPDVLGSLADHDIRSLEVQELSPTKLQINLALNYHGGDATLAAFAVPGSSFAAAPVGIGDVLIQGQSYLWAIPLSGPAGGPGGPVYYAVGGPIAVGTPITRSPVLAGSLYRVNGALTASQVLGVDPAADLRADEPVWGAIEAFGPDFSGFFPQVVSLGGSEIGIQLSVGIGPSFYDDVSGGYSIRFASTTCACDVISATVPEPAPLALVLGALGLCLRRRGGDRGSARD